MNLTDKLARAAEVAAPPAPTREDYQRDPFLGLNSRNRREAARIADRGGRGKLLKKYGPFQGAALADHFGLTRAQDARDRRDAARAPVSAREVADMVELDATRRAAKGNT